MPMRYFASFLVALAWALWLGGLIALFLFVSTLFRENRAIAIEAAPMMFRAFELLRFPIAACALVATLGLWFFARTRAVTSMFVLLAIASLLAVLSTTLVTGKMESLRRQGLSSSPEFRRLHGFSMIFYLSETGVLIAAGAALPAAVAGAIRGRDPAQPAEVSARSTPGTAEDTASA